MLGKIPEDKTQCLPGILIDSNFPLIANPHLICYARMEAITAVGLLLKFQVFWDVTLRGWASVYRRFGGL